MKIQLLVPGLTKLLANDMEVIIDEFPQQMLLVIWETNSLEYSSNN